MSKGSSERAHHATRIADWLADRRAAAQTGTSSRDPPGHVPVVAVPMANNPEVIGAIGEALSCRLARFALLGPVDDIRQVAQSGHVDLGDADLIEERDARRACERAADMAASGEADVLMKGLVQTSDFVRAILSRDRKLVPPGGLLSHVALCDVEGFDRIFLLTDAAITTYPDATQKRMLVENALQCAAALGMTQPRVAMVAPVEKVTAKIPSTTDAVTVIEGYAGDERLEIDGPFGLDLAISAEAARIKGVGGTVAGTANVLIMPNIDAGNVLYKSLTGFAGARIAGIVAGAAVPVVLTSRSDSEESKINALRFALIVSGAGRE